MMKLGILLLLCLACQLVSGQPDEKMLYNFAKAYEAAVDPTRALDTLRSITLEEHWFVKSEISSFNEIDQYKIRHLSTDSQENFNLVLKPDGWMKRGKSRFDSGENPWGLEKIREHFLLFDTADLENLAIRFSNDSITVIEKKIANNYGWMFTFDTKTKLPIAYTHSEGSSVTTVKHDHYKWFSNLQVQTRTEIDFGDRSTHVSQKLIKIHFNLTPEQAMALARQNN